MRKSVAAGVALAFVVGGAQAQTVDPKIAARVDKVLARAPLMVRVN